MWRGFGNFLAWLFCSKTRFFFHVSKLSATESSSGVLGSAVASREGAVGFPKFIIQSVSFEQLFGESAVVGSQRALSGQSRHGQSAMVSMDAGNLLG